MNAGPRPCLHGGRHAHGTMRRYQADRCRCEPCRHVNAIYSRRRRKLATWGRTPGGLVDSEPVRAHVRLLLAAGMSHRSIAAASGVTARTVNALLNGEATDRPPTARVKSDTARALLGVPVPCRLPPTGVRVDGVGVRRRLQALVAIGWTQAQLADQFGWCPPTLRQLLYGLRGEKVRAHTRVTVLDMYERLSMTTPVGPKADSARRLARSRGWAPPLAWDDDTIDNPAAQPSGCGLGAESLDEVAVERAVAGRSVVLNRVERAEVARRLTAEGCSAREIGSRLRMAPRSVARMRAAS